MGHFLRGTENGGFERLPLWRWPYDAAVYTWQTAPLFNRPRAWLFLRELKKRRRIGG
jgi:hypothetical protein